MYKEHLPTLFFSIFLCQFLITHFQLGVGLVAFEILRMDVWEAQKMKVGRETVHMKNIIFIQNLLSILSYSEKLVPDLAWSKVVSC